MRRIKSAAKTLFYKNVFVVSQRLGIDVLPRHFYSEIPHIAKLRRTLTWRKKYSMVAILGADCDEQLVFLRLVMASNIPETISVYERACQDNGAAGYGPIEAELLLHYIVRHQPKSIIQVGAGVSTAVILRGADIARYHPAITCIDPFPTKFLKRGACERRISLLDEPAEEVDLNILHQLDAGDFLFIDSTHTLGPAGEVTRLILEWLPRLKVGVHVHFHDITFPYDYPPDIVKGALFFQHETSLLHAFLCMNGSFKILCSLSMLHHDRQSDLIAIFPRYRPCHNEDGIATRFGHFPSAIYLMRAQ
jgi:Methyltransferase domain